MLTIAAIAVVAGAVLIATGVVLGRASGARIGLGRRLAAAREMRVGEVTAATVEPGSTIRVTGRVRCPNPLLTSDGERLVALHRTLEVRLGPLRGGAWRQLERVRESRRFQLWDHSGQLSIDPSAAAEPLLAIPAIWRGTPDELPDAYRASVAALEARHGQPATAARAETRTISVVDHLFVLAEAVPERDGSLGLAPPQGGFVISSVPLDSAMRLLGGHRRRALVGAVVAIAAGAIGVIGGAVIALVSVLA